MIYTQNRHTMLPILSYRESIRSLLFERGKLIVTAPPGTGKSTQIPQFFIDRLSPEKRMFVLEPRRIAARSLAYRVAEELGGACGETVGYQVRFERKVSGDTRIVFLTYGTFLQLLQSDPSAAHASIIAFDEFHERTLDADAALAWARGLAANGRPDLKLMVLSATLESGPLLDYMDGAAAVDVVEKVFPVDIIYQPPKPREPIADQVDRAFGFLGPGAEGGSVLVFLPGIYEIERATEKLYGRCARQGFRLMRLHGSMTLAEQQQVLRAPAGERCVIVSTNVAETSLTIPGVTAVIDSGLARIASFDPERDRNTLYVQRISMQNAAQRAGRAGRVAKGVCVRLWNREDERAMPAAIEPEVLRLDLAKSMLTLGFLQSSYAAGRPTERAAGLRWLTPPPAQRWNKARDDLFRYGAILPPAVSAATGEDARGGAGTAAASRSGPAETETPIYPLTPFGLQMSCLPLDPPIARILLEHRGSRERELCLAMAALWETWDTATSESNDLYDLAEAFLADTKNREWGKETRETFGQLSRILETGGSGRRETQAADGPKREVTRLWMRTFGHRIAAREREGSVFRLNDGRSARLVPKRGLEKDPPDLIVALVIREHGGRARALQASIPLYLPLDVPLVAEEFPGELRSAVACRWDESKRRVALEETTLFRGIVVKRRPCDRPGGHRNEVTACLVEKVREGVWNWRADEPRAEQFLFRIKLVSRVCPEMKIPLMSPDDIELVYHELCEGRSSLEELSKASMLQALKSYVGADLSRFIEKKAPDTILFPSGKKGRVTYFDTAPPELSARLGDFIGHPDRFFLLDGRVRGAFDILAPNFRTVQKTSDLGSFWKNVYPAIKKELQRKYPKHPWP